MRFEFATASRIVFGPGTVQEVAASARGMGNRAMLVTGKSEERPAPLLEALEKIGLKTSVFKVPYEPTVSLVCQGAEQARQDGCDLVVGMGGGSVIDGAKAIAALVTNDGDIFDYLEVIGRGMSLDRDPIPCIAIPTTAGTGTEVTKNAVLTSPEHGVKVSLRHPRMLPDLAVVDPELTHTMPPALTASSGLDALTQVLESFVSVKSNPLTDSMCREGLRYASRSLRRAYHDGEDPTAREDMAMVSLLSGLALANAKLGAVHGFAGPMGGMFSAPHGVLCARLLPFVMQANVRALETRGSPDLLMRYDEIARILTLKPEAKAEDGIAWVHALCSDFNIPVLSDVGVSEDRFAEIVSRAKKASSMKGNPVQLTDEEMIRILEQAV
jgi:alcohol dehydrogenase class IV